MERRSRRLPGAFLAAFAIVWAACADATTEPENQPTPSFSAVSSPSDYIVMMATETLPANFAAQLRAAGGDVQREFGEIGVAVVRADAPDFEARAKRAPGVKAVFPDVTIQWHEPPRAVEVIEAVAGGDVVEAASLGDDETFYALQWAPGAIRAPEAWAAGYTGRGVRVAVLDGGIHSSHIDLAPNLDVARSVSFVPGVPFNEDLGTFWHGTHVAGIIAAADNGIGTIGIAPEATLIGVKVLHGGSGQFSWMIQGILYAATPIEEGGAGAHIINLSLGALLDEKATDIKHAVKDLMKAIDRAMAYAHKRGVTVIAAAGNDAIDTDAMKELTFAPAANLHVISVSATGPFGWALGATDFDRPASYSNFGRSLIDIAAPGGDFALPGEDICIVNTLQGPIAQVCWALDMVISTVRGSGTSVASYSWSAGTSMAAPAVAGVAALLLQRHGPMPPAELQARLLQTANGNGKDPFYGRGFVDAWNAVR